MNKLLFSTTNKGKLSEAQDILKVPIEGISLEIDEVQSLDPVYIATKKALAYYAQLKQPLFVDDAALTFNALKQLPGPYMGDFIKAVGVEGLLDLIKDKKDRSAVAQSTIAYIDEHGLVHVFEGKLEGTISTELRGTNGFGWDPIFIPNGYDKTFAEMTDEEKNSCSMRKLALEQMAEFLKNQN